MILITIWECNGVIHIVRWMQDLWHKRSVPFVPGHSRWVWRSLASWGCAACARTRRSRARPWRWTHSAGTGTSARTGSSSPSWPTGPGAARTTSPSPGGRRVGVSGGVTELRKGTSHFYNGVLNWDSHLVERTRKPLKPICLPPMSSSRK